MLDNLDIMILLLVLFIILCFFYLVENFVDLESEEKYLQKKIVREKNNNISTDLGSNIFMNENPVDPISSEWDKKIDYCKKRFGTLHDIDLNETLLDYKPKVILY